MIKTLKTIDYDKEQIQTLLKSKFSAFGGNFLVPIIFFFIYKDEVPMYLLSIWLISQFIVFIFRIYFSSKILKKLDSLDKKIANNQLKNYLYTIFANSFLWGLASLLVVLYSDEIGLYIFFIIIMGIMTAAMSTLSVVFHAIFTFVFNIISILVVSFIVIGGENTHYLLAFFGLFYLVFVLTASFKSFVYMNASLKQQDELKEKNSNFKNLLDITMEAIIILDENHVIEDINQSGLFMLNAKDKSNIIGQTLIKYISFQSMQNLHQSMLNNSDEPLELILKKDDGESFPALVSLKESVIDARVIRIITILDLTKIKEKDRQLMQQSRLAQMGEMISMIAHQWRQPLTAISATSSNLSLRVMLDDYDGDEFESELALISEYSQHLSKTIDDFRGFFKEDKVKLETTLETVVKETLGIAKVSIESKNITINTKFDSNKTFKTYPSELKQVVLNLIKNAEDILVEKEIQEPTIGIKTLFIDDTHILIVKDNAGGIPQNIKDKIFEPYFSTKLEKDGTGLGLYMSKTIIEEHCGGTLTVTNDSEGAVFKIIIKDS